MKRQHIRFLICSLLASGAFVHAQAHASENDRRLAAQSQLNGIVENADVPLAGASLTVQHGDKILFDGVAGCALFRDHPRRDGSQPCKRRLTPGAKMRMASISKMAVALAAVKLAEDGAINLDADISDYLGWRFRNPSFPDAPITARHLMAHVSSIRDPQEYWVAAPGALKTLLEASPEIFAAPGEDGASRAPGAYFTYSNLNYGILASVMERAAGERFDILMREGVLAPLGLDAGFNWSGVSKQTRKNNAALYRREEGLWRVQVDGPDMMKGDTPVFLKSETLESDAYLAAYQPGDNATLFSPQGGLRASTRDLVKLLSLLKTDEIDPATPVWRLTENGLNGDTDGDFFRAYGLGVHTMDESQTGVPGYVFTGHAGEAYGLYSGAWRARDVTDQGREDVLFSFAVTGVFGTPSPGAYSGFNAVEEKLAALAFEIVQRDRDAKVHDKAHKDNEPRPYDASRNAMADVDAALARAKQSDKRVLLVLGANWCHDSRGFAGYVERPEFAKLIERSFELVYVDVGRRDRNLDVGARFGAPQLFGTPTILVLTGDGKLLNADTMHEWRTAASKPYESVVGYFTAFAPSKAQDDVQ